MWARVKYLLDGQILNRPLTFFKATEVIEAELKENQVRDEYRVFWSPNDYETPDDIFRKEHRILDVDKVMWAVDDVPLAGFYKAAIVNYAESEEALLELLKTPQSRRPVKVTKRTTSKERTTRSQKREAANNSKAAHKHNLKKFKVGQDQENAHNNQAPAGKSCDHSDNNDNISGEPQVQSDNYKNVELNMPTSSTKQQVARASPLHRKKSNFTEGSESESLSDMDDVPYVEHMEAIKKIKDLEGKMKLQECMMEKLKQTIIEARDKAKEFEEKSEASESQVKKLEMEVRELTSLNKWWQEEEIKRRNRQRSSSHSSSSKHGSHSSSSHSSSSNHGSHGRHRSLSRSSSSNHESHGSHRSSSHSSSSKHSNSSPKIDSHSSPSSKNLSSLNTTVLAKTSDPLETAHLPSPKGIQNFHSGNTSPLQLFDDDISLDTFAAHNSTPKNDLNTKAVELTNSDDNSGDKARATCSLDETKRVEFLSRDDEAPAFDIHFEGVNPLTYGQFKSCRTQGMKNKPGQVGDPMFVKNVAGCLWTPEEMMNRSAAGKSASTSDKAPRPECTPKKREYCSALLKMRITLEEPCVSEGDLVSRIKDNKIKNYFRDKIKAVRRAAGLRDE